MLQALENLTRIHTMLLDVKIYAFFEVDILVSVVLSFAN